MGSSQEIADVTEDVGKDLSLKTALVTHPTGFSIMGGGELVCLYAIKALQELNYQVTLATDRFQPGEVERHFGDELGTIMSQCEHIPVSAFRPKLPFFTALQRLEHARKTRGKLEGGRWDVVFNTQSALYFPFRSTKTFHFIYDAGDLQVLEFSERSLRDLTPYHVFLRYYRKALVSPEPNRTFLALSNNIFYRLRGAGFANSRLILPPCAPVTRPGVKHTRVVQVTRVVPQKRLEFFIEAAHRLPDYEFYVVARTDRQYEAYRNQLLSNAPANTHFVEKAIRETPELLSTSQVYYYTSQEPGINIATVEGILAGCYPVCPSIGGGAEIIQETGIGTTFATIDEAVAAIRSGMETDLSPNEISRKGRIFSPETFVEKVKREVSTSLA